MSWAQEFRKSIKSIEAEDRIDLFFYRPLGFLLAKLAHRVGLYPTHVTILGAASGLVAGVFFYLGGHLGFTAGLLLFLLAGILDSADGQLARMSGRSTPFGMVLDGLCDNIVFAAVYIGCIVPLMPRYGWSIWLIAFPAGFSHSLQSSLLDFYNREYLFYTLKEGREHYWNPLVEEVKSERGWASRLRITWIWQQELLSARSPAGRLSLREASERSPNFTEVYRRHNRPLLHFWRPLGANVHTAAIIVFVFLGRFELYLLLVDLVALNLWLCLGSWVQARADSELKRELGLSLAKA